MKNYSDYRPPSRDMLLWSNRKAFQNHLNMEGVDISVDGNSEIALVRYHTNPINEFVENRKVTLWNDSKIRRGSLVETLDDKRMFLTLSQINENAVVKYALIREINHDLKWINSKDELLVIPSIVSTKTLYNTGIRDESMIEIPNGMVGIQMQHNIKTDEIVRNDTFIFNKTKYRTTFYDETNYGGIIVLICEEIGRSYLDDKINGISDRWKEVNGVLVDRLPWLDNQKPDMPDEPVPPVVPGIGTAYTMSVIKEYQTDIEYEVSNYGWQKYVVKKTVNGVEAVGNLIFTLNKTVKQLTGTQEDDNTYKLSLANLLGVDKVILSVIDEDTGKVVLEKEIFIRGR